MAGQGATNLAAVNTECKVTYADFSAATDEELRRRASEGDQAAFAELNRRRAFARAWTEVA